MVINKLKILNKKINSNLCQILNDCKELSN